MDRICMCGVRVCAVWSVDCGLLVGRSLVARKSKKDFWGAKTDQSPPSTYLISLTFPMLLLLFFSLR